MTLKQLKVNLINGFVFLKYKLGVHPIKLRNTYKSLLRERAKKNWMLNVTSGFFFLLNLCNR